MRKYLIKLKESRKEDPSPDDIRNEKAEELAETVNTSESEKSVENIAAAFKISKQLDEWGLKLLQNHEYLQKAKEMYKNEMEVKKYEQYASYDDTECIDEDNVDASESLETNTTSMAKIVKQLEVLSTKLHQNHVYLLRANEMKERLLSVKESGEDLPPYDDLYDQIDEFAQAVDGHSSEVSAIAKEIQIEDMEEDGSRYPVPWVDVRTVSFLMSLIGSENVVSLSPKEVANTINKDVLITHYEKYLQKAKSKQDMVDNVTGIMKGSLNMLKGRTDVIRSFVDKLDPIEKGSSSKEYYEKKRSILLETKVHLKQTADDLSLLIGRVDQYAIERSALSNELSKFLRKKIPLFPEYKNI